MKGANADLLHIDNKEHTNEYKSLAIPGSRIIIETAWN